jgi:thiol-disulfide isomerase/thioredoxin
MMTLQNTQKKYIDYIKNTIGDKKGVLVIFSATWCNPCKRIKELLIPEIPKLIKNVTIVFIDIDTDKENYHPFLKKQRVVRGVPSLLLYLKKTGGEYSHYPDFFCETNIKHFNTLLSTINNL